eukprot:12581367-Ditylum_brightwellii.AAC.1
MPLAAPTISTDERYKSTMTQKIQKTKKEKVIRADRHYKSTIAKELQACTNNAACSSHRKH